VPQGQDAVFDGLFADIKHKIDFALKTTAFGVAAITAALVAGAFFCAASFVWIQQAHGAIIACLALGGAFVALAVIALIVLILYRRRAPPPRARAAWWNDPAMLATALEISRAFGGRRMTSMALVSALVVGLLLSRSADKRGK
jgi:hypothetical protein